ncbi:hypothetical protein L7F22_067263 [Adiantum nelumboides]|nr:hypothetical protein [Adiantum nelumboides]
MGHEYRPLFELIIEESRRQAWESESGRSIACPDVASHPPLAPAPQQHAEIADPHTKKQPKKKKRPSFLVVGRWLTRQRPCLHSPKPILTNKPISTPISSSSSISPSPTLYESAHDSTSSTSCHHSSLNMPSSSDSVDDLHCLSLSCLQDDGDTYLALAVALDMMQLSASQACVDRDTALAQAADLSFLIDTICSRLHQVEQHCLHLNYQLLMNTTSAP